MRPTRIREIKMRKYSEYGVHHIDTDKQAEFLNAATAIMALQALQMLYTLQGYLTYSHINVSNGCVELTIYFEGKPFPKLPQGYLYTRREITSFTYWSNQCRKLERIRRVIFRFEFKK